MAATNVVEPRPTHRVRTRYDSYRTSAHVESGQLMTPESLVPVGEAPDFSPPVVHVGPDVRMTQSELYPVRHAFRPEHLTALRLLTVAVGRFKRALEAMAESDILAADTEIQKVQVLLPELFCCRTLGDGFATIVNAFMSAFEGLAGNTLNLSQIKMMNRVFELLKERPFLSADEAADAVEMLESAGLQIHPAELMEFLSSV